jgi:phospholipase/carboxylesterase
MTLNVLAIPPQNNQRPDFVLVLLHGWGANNRDLTPLVSMLGLPKGLYLFPNAPYPHEQVPDGRAWYALEKNNQGIENSLDLFYQWLLSLEDKTDIPLQKTIVGGFSQGGAMSLDIGLQLPVAGVFSFSGYLHFEPSADRNPFPPALICHGTQDAVVPIHTAQECSRKLQAVGVDVEYHEFDIAHEIIPAEAHLLRDFILKRTS